MKSKLVIAILAVTLLFCQGLAFAESADNVTAATEETAMTGESANGTINDAVATTDELVAPAAESEKEPATEAKETTEETEKM